MPKQPSAADLTRKERIAAAKRSLPSTLRADRIAAPLYAEQFGEDADEVWAEDEAASPLDAATDAIHGLFVRFMASIAPLPVTAPAGTQPSLPSEWQLPAEWTSHLPDVTDEVSLYFEYDRGQWWVTRSGTMHVIRLEVRGAAGELLGEPIDVDATPKPLPITTVGDLNHLVILGFAE